MNKETKFTKTQGHHCWWLNIHGESVANFNHEIDVNDLVMAGNMMPKLYAEIESEIEFLKELREDSHTEYQITLLDEKIEQKQRLLAEARGEK